MIRAQALQYGTCYLALTFLEQLLLLLMQTSLEDFIRTDRVAAINDNRRAMEALIAQRHDECLRCVLAIPIDTCLPRV